MKVGIGNKLTSAIGVPYALLLRKKRNRNPRAILFHEFLAKDLTSNSLGFTKTLRHMYSLGFPKSKDLNDFLGTLSNVYQGNTTEDEVINVLTSWSNVKTRPTTGQWLEISMYLLSMGFFRSSYTARKISHEYFESFSNKLIYNFNYYNLLMASYFDQGNIQIMEKLSLRSNNPYWKAIFNNNSNPRKKEDETFYNLLFNKRVAIIGPLAFAKDYRVEIADYDVVVELNALKSKRDAVSIKYHGKPDIVYYSNYRSKQLNLNGFEDTVNDAKFFVLKTSKFQEQLKQSRPTRVISTTSMLNWNGSFSMLENTVADLLLFQPAEIKVYGVNLYTSFNYDKAYGNAPPENLQRITLNFSVHDIFTQYAFMHNLYNLGLIKGDDEFEEVLKLGREDYVNRMSDLYPKFLLTRN